jgi:YVTN family beta-propeller protein
MKKNVTICLLLSIISFSTRSFAQTKNKLRLVNTFHIASSGGWDYLAIQPHSNKLFVSHGTQVNIIDKSTGDSLGVILNTTGVHGIAFVTSLNKGYTSNGRLNNVSVFDLKTDTVISQIAVGENPDAIFYDEYSKKIIICNGRSKDITILDPLTDKVIATIPVGGKPETAVSNGKGKLFVNVEDKNEIAVINSKTFTVESHWSITPGEAPTGLAIDNNTNRLFAACSDNKLLMVLDAENGKIVDSIKIGDGCDGDVFDAKNNLIYTSNGDGTITVIKEENKDKFSVVTNIDSKKGARTITMDFDSNKLYLPTAEFEEKLPTEKRARPKAGTFQILVFGY